ncbi:MAG: hypothetical protein ACTHJJ_17260, partial [Intrasporangium sp.]
FLRFDNNHHHVFGGVGGAIAFVYGAFGERPCLHASDDHGFVIDEAEVIYWGRCPSCLEDLADASDADRPGRATTAADETAVAASVSAD